MTSCLEILVFYGLVRHVAIYTPPTTTFLHFSPPLLPLLCFMIQLGCTACSAASCLALLLDQHLPLQEGQDYLFRGGAMELWPHDIPSELDSDSGNTLI